MIGRGAIRLAGALAATLAASIPQPAQATKNPAAVYCRALGYQYRIVTEPSGERGLCVLPDGRSPDAWRFLIGEEAPEHSFCAKKGYARKTAKDPLKCSRLGMEKCLLCVLPDGAEVEVTEVMRLSFDETVCGDGRCRFPENTKTCPADCPPGGPDELCDGAADGRCDPDCPPGKDPDCKQ